MKPEDELVSVIVPLFNAAGTIAETLRSIRAQTHRNLEVIVVDDGSTDDSAARVERAARADQRIRLLRRANRGVAAARNSGAQHARGELLAPIDADDLWAADKLALQLAAMREGGADVGMVYTWYALIDEQSRVLSLAHRPTAEGRILRQLCRSNLVGNGSCALIRRDVFQRVGGYDETLRAHGAQGCEDLQIALRIAEHHEIRLVRRHLTGYRLARVGMSSDVLQMLRSFERIADEWGRSYPEFGAELDQQWDDVVHWLLMRALTAGRVGPACQLMRQVIAHRGVAAGLAQLLRESPRLARAGLPPPIRAAIRRLLRRPAAALPSFLSVETA